jgi:hypothetical protein
MAESWQLLSFTLTKVYGIQRRFSWSQTFSFNKILFRFISFMTEIFCFMKILQLPISEVSYTPLFFVFHKYSRVCLLQCKQTFKENNPPSGISLWRQKNAILLETKISIKLNRKKKLNKN